MVNLGGKDMLSMEQLAKQISGIVVIVLRGENMM
jgi:hypothetical protein